MALSLKPIEIVESGKYPLLNIHPSWDRIFLGEIADVQNGFAFSSKFFSRENGFPLIRIRDVLKNKTETFYEGGFSEDYIVVKGDIIIGMDGDFNAGIWNGENALLNQRVCRLKFKSGEYSKKFLFLCLQL